MFSVRLADRDGQQLSMSMFDGREINEMVMMGVIAAEPQSSNCCQETKLRSGGDGRKPHQTW